MDNINDKLLSLYILSEMAYKKHFEGVIDNIDELFPQGWYEIKKYKEKIEIISEAIKTNSLVVNTLGYQNLVEGVKYK